MRIRKRQVPFPLSSLSPIPISDPLINLNQPPPVVVQLYHYDPSRNDAVNLHPQGNPSREPYPATHFTPQPSDRPVNHRLSPIGAGNINRRTDGCDFSDADNRNDHKDTMNNKKKEDRLELFLKDGEDNNKGDDISKGSTPSAEANSRFSFPESTISSTSPSQVVMKTSYWCEGEKVFPLKKRKGSFLPGEEEDGNYHDYHHKEQHNKKITTNVIKTVKAKTAQKKESNSSRKNDDISNQQQYDDDHHNQHNHQLGSNNSGKSNKKGRGGALVEGSRCSRVNGRGWRCCQQTLVGYSLCEHHLGKGRLRSMTSVRSRSMLAKSSPSSSSAATAITTAQMGSLHEVKQEKEPKLHRNVERMIRDSIIINEEDDDEDDDEDDYDDDDDDEDYGEHDFEKNKNKNKKKPLRIANKKRVKLGMVKARSISSLLGQTNSCTTSTGTTGAISMADSKY
ncbi:uncharacterized protein LOC115701270 [Cannabis sativa]|uniref:uncharacterized protein LOC115701270 n=1 Tax=Cannabis sativa TaxID=3483 RepID=UPI0029CA7B3F|nr:uncharacterized protein LOC115701270 [Cannabis sativa]